MLSRLEADGSARRRLERPRPRGPRRPGRARGGALGRRRPAASGRVANVSGPGRRLPPLDRRRGVPRDRPRADAGAAAGPGPDARRRAQRLRQVELRRGARGPPHRRQPALEGARRRLARGLAEPPPSRGVARRDVPRRGRARTVRGVAPLGAGGGVRGRRGGGPARRQAERPTSSPWAGPRPCAPIAPSSPTTSWARSSTRGPRSSTTPSPRSWGSRTSSRRWAPSRRPGAPARRPSRTRPTRGAACSSGCASVDDARARQVVAALEGKEWDLGAVDEVLAGVASPGAGAAEVDVLRGIASLEPPDPARVAAAVAEMRGAAAAVRSARETAAARSRDAAALLESALQYHAAHGDGDCPVCGRKGALDGAWSAKQREAAARLREAAREADAVHERAEAARRQWEGLVTLKADAFTRAAEVGLDLGELVEALGTWVEAGAITDLGALADHVESASGPLREAVVRLRDSARAELGRKEDAWRPVAVEVAAWLAGAREAVRGAADLKRLKSAEAWLKKAAAGIRDDRFAPIAEKAAADLGAPPPAEPRRARADPAHRRGHAAPRGPRRHRRRRRGRGPGGHEPGRAALARPQPLRPARHAPREPLPLHRHRRPGAVDGPGPGRRPGPRPRERLRRPPGRGLHPRRPAAGSGAPPRHRRRDHRGDAHGTRRSWSCAGPSIPSGATSRTPSRWPARPTSRRRRRPGWCRGCVASASRPRAWRWCVGGGSAAGSPTPRSSGPWATRSASMRLRGPRALRRRRAQRGTCSPAWSARPERPLAEALEQCDEGAGEADAAAAVELVRQAEQARGVAPGAGLRSHDGEPRDLLDLADGLLRRADPATAGLWPRASALLALAGPGGERAPAVGAPRARSPGLLDADPAHLPAELPGGREARRPRRPRLVGPEPRLPPPRVRARADGRRARSPGSAVVGELVEHAG